MPDIRHWGLLINGEWRIGKEQIEVRNAFDGELVGSIVRGTNSDIQEAIGVAQRALGDPFPAHARYDVLMRTADRIDESAEKFALLIASEGSKTITEARNEPPRAAGILRLAAEEARQLSGRTLPFDTRPGSENRIGYFVRKPAGVVAAIMPFNDPMAVAAHKIGPALAAGNSIVIKPDSSTPLSILGMAEALAESGLPAGRLNVVTGHGSEIGDALVSDPRVRVVVFTGGVKTGLRITQKAGIKKLILELGANSPVIVMPDADPERTCSAIVAGAFAQAGQNCLGVQRVFIQESVYEAFAGRLAELTNNLKAGHSMDPTVDVCQLIRESEAVRVESWVQEAVQGGARIVAGGHRSGAVYEATILERVPTGSRLDREEIYGPVVSLYPFSSLEEAVERANAVDYGLHAAIFTESIRDAMYAAEHLHVGAVMVNDSTDYRLDSMPFGGTGLSGIGREGLKFAVEAMTETRVVCFNL